MKKIIAILLLFVAMNASAQHLQFMGIPLNGSIDAFQQKLIAKGLTYYKEFGVRYPGARWFDGIFCGYNANVIVYYDTKTKVVYGAKAIIRDTELKNIESKYNEIKEMLNDKYVFACHSEDQYKGRESLSIIVFKKEDGVVWLDCGSEDFCGCIDMYIFEFDGYDEKEYSLHIEYTDRINEKKNKSSKADDL